MSGSSDEPGPRSHACFTTTHWSVVLAAGGQHSPQAARADRAKGKFRTFLLHTLNQFLADQRERATALKRGGGKILISLEEEAPEDRYRLEVADELTPEVLFERRWAQTILDRALDRLREEHVADGKEAAYEILRAFEPGERSPLSYADAAGRLGVSESAVKSMIHRLRQRHRELVREEIAHTVPTVADIDEELRHLVSVLRGVMAVKGATFPSISRSTECTDCQEPVAASRENAAFARESPALSRYAATES